MTAKSPLCATERQRTGLAVLAGLHDRGDPARAMLLTLAGRTSPRIAEAFDACEDTVDLWCSAFTAGGVDALKARLTRQH